MAILELEAQPAFLDVILQSQAATRDFALAIAWPCEIVAYGWVAAPFPRDADDFGAWCEFRLKHSIVQ